MTVLNDNSEQRDIKIEVFIVFALLVSLGFPGNFTEIYGDNMGMVMEYGAFFAEILAMLFSSGRSWMDVQIINLDRKYGVLYLFVTILFIESMAVTRYPSLQAITCIRLAVTLLFAIWLQEQYSFQRVVELLCMAQAIFIFCALVYIFLYPSKAFESGSTYINALRGLYSTKNTFASELCFGILLMSFLVRQKLKAFKTCRIWLIFLAIQVVLLIMCQATGPLLCLAASLLMLFIPGRIRLPLGWLYAACSTIFLFAALTLMPAFEWFFEMIGKDATLTGRIPLWNQIIAVMMDHNTLTGFGYGMFWRDSRAVALIHAAFDENSFLGTMTTGAHNVLLEFWLNSGLIGLGMLFLSVLYSMKNAAGFPEEKYKFCSMLLMYLMINGFTERCLGGNYDYKMFIFLLLLAIGCGCSKGANPILKAEKEKTQIPK